MSTTTRYEHSGSAGPTTLTADIAPSTTTLSLADGTGYPTGSIGPFVMTLGRGTTNEERVLCASRTSTTVTVTTRGWDGTVARSHNSGTVAEHTWSQTEADQANDHTSTGAAVHGLAGNVVGTTDTQTLTNKTLAGAALSGTISGTPTFPGPVVLTTPTINGAALSGTLSGNPTFSGAPVLANFTGMAHDHGDADDGGLIPESSVTNLVTDLAAKEATANKGVASGYGSLDSTVKQPVAQNALAGVQTITDATGGNFSSGTPTRNAVGTATGLIVGGIYEVLAVVEGFLCTTNAQVRASYRLFTGPTGAHETNGLTIKISHDNTTQNGGASVAHTFTADATTKQVGMEFGWLAGVTATAGSVTFIVKRIG